MEAHGTSCLQETSYSDYDVERFLDEPSRSGRPTFERDRARIVHSAGLRRLAAKTQVVGPSSDDFIRNRLTHTLEVAQVGRDLAYALGCNPDLVEAACLAHDLGHPPFGHNGERALNDAARSIGGFEGNAQTFRLLTRLESKTADARGRSLGLNLTRATLDAASKYPWTYAEASTPGGRHGDGLPRTGRKFGVYDDDLEVFTWMRHEAPAHRVCVEAQVMDFADDVAYSVHDVEDGIVAGRIELTRLADDPELLTGIWETVRDWYLPGQSDDELAAAYDRLTRVDGWPQTRYDGTRPHFAGLKTLTSRLINRFCAAVQRAVTEAGLPAGLARYDTDIPVPTDTVAEIGVLKGIAAHLVMKADDRVAALEHQRALITELVVAMTDRGRESLEPIFRADLDAASDDAARLRVVIDQVASLTDPSAVDAHRRLVGTA
jgi:dGTPase